MDHMAGVATCWHLTRDIQGLGTSKFSLLGGPGIWVCSVPVGEKDLPHLIGVLLCNRGTEAEFLGLGIL